MEASLDWRTVVLGVWENIFNKVKRIAIMDNKRGSIIRSLVLAPLFLGTRGLLASHKGGALVKSRVQYSVNAYSFNAMLRSGEKALFGMMAIALAAADRFSEKAIGYVRG